MRKLFIIFMSVAAILAAMLMPPAAIVAMMMLVTLFACASQAVAAFSVVDTILPKRAPLLALAGLRAPPRR
jgi:hypothetical protein